MEKSLRIDSVDLRMGGAQIDTAAQSASSEFAEHETNLNEAQAGWVGASKEALHDLTASLARQHAADYAAASKLTEKMLEAAARYENADTGASDAVARVADAMGL